MCRNWPVCDAFIAWELSYHELGRSGSVWITAKPANALAANLASATLAAAALAAALAPAAATALAAAALALTTAAAAAAAPSGSSSAPSGSSSAISAASIFSGWRLLDSCLQRWQSDVFVAWKLRTCNLLHHKPLLFDGFIGASYTLSLQQQHYMDYFCNELNKLLTRIQWCTLHQRYFGAARHPTA